MNWHGLGFALPPYSGKPTFLVQPIFVSGALGIPLMHIYIKYNGFELVGLALLEDNLSLSTLAPTWRCRALRAQRRYLTDLILPIFDSYALLRQGIGVLTAVGAFMYSI
jgi:hypothetical protein